MHQERSEWLFFTLFFPLKKSDFLFEIRNQDEKLVQKFLFALRLSFYKFMLYSMANGTEKRSESSVGQ